MSNIEVRLFLSSIADKESIPNSFKGSPGSILSTSLPIASAIDCFIVLYINLCKSFGFRVDNILVFLSSIFSISMSLKIWERELYFAIDGFIGCTVNVFVLL
ncbi:hypothetical protein HWI79_133 [Cryptosporidium felis]|nr:hypothetical protein HWI79_133 [Cryptosporidium felis]